MIVPKLSGMLDIVVLFPATKGRILSAKSGGSSGKSRRTVLATGLSGCGFLQNTGRIDGRKLLVEAVILEKSSACKRSQKVAGASQPGPEIICHTAFDPTARVIGCDTH